MVLVSGLLILSRAIDDGAKEDFFKRTFFSVIAVGAITEFLLNLRPLGLVLELLLLPALVFLLAMLSVVDIKPEELHVRSFSRWFLAAIGVSLLAYTIAGMVASPNEFYRFENLLNSWFRSF